MRSWVPPVAVLALAGCTSDLAPFFGADAGGPPRPVEFPDPSVSPTPTASPTPEFGDGHDGEWTVAANEIATPTKCVALAGAGGNTVGVVTPLSAEIGDWLLVVQMRDGTHAKSNAPSPDVGDTQAGTFQLLGVTEVYSAQSFGVTPAVASFGSATQVCLVPQYENVIVETNARITADAYSTTSGTGGIVAFAVKDTLSLTGRVDAVGLGFPGGVVGTASADGTDVSLADPDGGGNGHSLSLTAPGTGRGSIANGGGGGNTERAGGGGGGNGGAGGLGGNDTSNAAVGGVGGARVVASTIRLLPGGGGGGGAQKVGGGDPAGAGGAGGGIILVFAHTIEALGGGIDASGKPGDSSGTSTTNASMGGAGGGGAGGTIYLRTSAIVSGNVVARVRGGDGGHTYGGDRTGPGGSGGGGRLYHAGAAPIFSGSGGAVGISEANAVQAQWGAMQGAGGLEASVP